MTRVLRRGLITEALERHELQAVAVALQLLTAVGSVIPIFLAFAMPPSYLTRAFVLEFVALSVGVPLVIACRRGHVMTAGKLAIGSMWVILTVACLTASGVYNPAFNGYIVLVAATGILVGRRQAYRLAGLSIASGAVLIALDALHVVPHREYVPAAVLIFNAVYLVMGGGLLSLAHHRTSSAADSARAAQAAEHQAIAQLKESEERFHRLADATHEGIVFSERGNVVDANRQAATMLGYDLSEMIGRPVTSLVAPESTELVVERMGSGREDPYELTALCRDGERVEVEARPRLVPFEGRQVRASVLRDITAQKRAAEERLRLLSAIEQAGEMIVITDPRGRVIYVNGAVVPITGRKPENVMGRPIVGLLSANPADPQYLEMRKRAASHQQWSGRIACGRLDGEAYVLDLTVTPVRAPGGVVTALVGVGRDVSAELAQEDQLRQAQRMETVGQLAGGIAHDFNNLMSPVLGYAELLLDELPADSPHREPLSVIRAAADKARQLTQQLLAFGRKQVIQVQPLDLGAVVNEFTRIMRRTIREDVDIDVRLAPEPTVVKGDARQLEQVLMNLVINAQDAMPNGGRLVLETAIVSAPDDVPMYPDLPAGIYVQLNVSDTGGGIDPAVLPHIFEPFYTTKEKGRGTGLGLSTVYGVVTQQDGHIRVQSTPGSGTCFSVFLPRVEAPATAHVALLGVPTDSRGSETVVIAEDEEMVRTLVGTALRQRGYHVIEVAEPEHCLRVLDARGRRPDLLLTDVVMPKVNGRELYAQLEAVYPGLKVLYMSGYLDDVIGSHGVLDAGVAYIQKPFSIAALASKVRSVLEG